MERNSGGAVDFDVVGWRDLNEFPAFEDGFRYQADQYVHNRRAGSGWHVGNIDFPRIADEQGLVNLVDSGAVDEVWLFGDHFFVPVIGESWMAGSGAFDINGPTFPQVPSQRAFACMGFNYERGVAEMLHDLGHRTEATMNRIYDGWDLAHPTSNWDRFSANATQSNGAAGVGTTHYPANAQSDYDTFNPRIVQSWADDFLNYPNLTGAPMPVNRDTWARGSNPDYERDYQNWYFAHLPRAAGVNVDGKQNNWWKYVFNFNNYTADGQPKPLSATGHGQTLYNLGGSSYSFAVAYSGAVGLKVSSLDDADVRVTGPNRFSQLARLQSVSDASDGTYRVAYYTIAAPGGHWAESHRGKYSITLQHNQVLDTAGQFVPGAVIGSFSIPHFRDSFQQTSRTLSLAWTVRQGRFTDQAVSGSGARGADNLALVQGLAQANVSVQADLNSTKGSAGLVARYRGSRDRNYYLAAMSIVRGQPQFTIYRNLGGNLRVLAVGRGNVLGPGTLRFETVGTTLKLYWNNQLMAQAVDRTLSSGLVGIRLKTGAAATNFQVTAVQNVLSGSIG